MLRRILLIIGIVIMDALLSQGQKLHNVTTEYLYQIPENTTLEAAKAMALERAKQQAIADEFGMTVSQTNTTSMEVVNGDVSSRFMSLGGSELKGEWVETIGEPEYELLTEGVSLAVRVKIKGKIRELSGSKIPIKIQTFRNGIDKCNESCDFMDGDALYMSFNSTSNGYLAVYLVDSENQVYCLLPYQSQSTGYYPTKANHRHLLFNREYADGDDKNMVDELIMTTDSSRESNRIFTIFSPNKFFKAIDSKVDESLPRNLSYAEFEKWLNTVKRHDVELAISETIITISQK